MEQQTSEAFCKEPVWLEIANGSFSVGKETTSLQSEVYLRWITIDRKCQTRQMIYSKIVTWHKLELSTLTKINYHWLQTVIIYNETYEKPREM